MTFNFEPSNNEPSLLVVHIDDNFLNDMHRVNPQPPQYDQRTVDDVALTADLDHFDKMDAFYLANKKFNDNASKYAQSELGKNYHLNYEKSKKNN